MRDSMGYMGSCGKRIFCVRIEEVLGNGFEGVSWDEVEVEAALLPCTALGVASMGGIGFLTVTPREMEDISVESATIVLLPMVSVVISMYWCVVSRISRFE